MRKLLAPLAVTALLLAGCSGGADAGPAPMETVTVTAEPEPAETITAEPEPAETVTVEAGPEAVPEPAEEAGTTDLDDPVTSDRGTLVKDVGEMAGLIGSKGEPVVTLTVDSIGVDQPCTEPFAEPSWNGHFVFLDVTVQTQPNLLDEYGIPFDLTSGWTAIGADGTTENGDPATAPAWLCLPESQMLPYDIGPGQTATGTIVLDVADPSGILVWEDMMWDGGFEWEYPAG